MVINARAVAVKVLLAVIQKNHSLTEALDSILPARLDRRDIALIKQYCYGTLRWYFRLKSIAKNLIYKPLKARDQDIELLLILGLYQLIYLNTPHYAAISETVEATIAFKKIWAKGLINQALHQLIRHLEQHLKTADETLMGKFSHPQWMIDKLQRAWPCQWQDILLANNQPPPFFIRVNLLRVSREQYQCQLAELSVQSQFYPQLSQALRLETALSVDELPGIEQGSCSVQDLASQYVVTLLDCRSGLRILDACAAPGGKTCHILETYPQRLNLMAIDRDPQRLKLVEENLQRLQLSANALKLLSADARKPDLWWDGQPFDRILLDAPCSGSGVIRRHPDIKILRKPDDIANYAQQQYELLTALWPLLIPGGRLVYTTCSIFPEENVEVTKRFSQNFADARPLLVEVEATIPQTIGCQLLPSITGGDGFYYAVFIKCSGTEPT